MPGRGSGDTAEDATTSATEGLVEAHRKIRITIARRSSQFAPRTKH
jgi:hypothetical protein